MKTAGIPLKRSIVLIQFLFFLCQASKRKGNLPPMENKPKQEDILNAILPPREWVEQGKFT